MLNNIPITGDFEERLNSMKTLKLTPDKHGQIISEIATVTCS